MFMTAQTKAHDSVRIGVMKEEGLLYNSTNARNPTNNQTPTVTRKQ